MKWWAMVIVVLCLASTGCATLLTGEVGTPINAAGAPLPKDSAPLVVRSREIEDMSSEHLPVLEVSFENPGSEWLNITAAKIMVGNPEAAGPVKIPVGQPLRDWQVAVQQRNAVERANQETALELLTAGALVVSGVGMGSDDEGVQVASATLGVAALSALAVDHYAERKHEAEAFALVPPTHLLGGPISVPPGHIVKRWILLHTPKVADPADLRLIVSYDLAERGNQRVLLRLKPHPPQAEGRIM